MSIGDNLQRLLAVSGESIGGPVTDAQQLSSWGRLGHELTALLCARNGFYAFESALLVRPIASTGPPAGLHEWNDVNTWRSSYGRKIEDALFFAEDLFGTQFCVRREQVCVFDPETAEFEDLGRSLDDWAAELLANADYRTGYPLAHEWQEKNGPLGAGVKLRPTIPFVFGGEYHVNSLHAIHELEAIRFCASVAAQLRNLPDGTQATLRVVDE